MKSVLVISGSPRPKGNTRKVLRLVEEELSRRGDVAFEHISLGSLHIETCRGCLKCMRRHEARCPCHDDLLGLRDKMLAADAVIFASPVYVHTVTALMKNLFDRLAFHCHQPAFHDVSALLVTTSELTGARETLDYMRFVCFTWGFRIAGELGVVYPSFVAGGRYRAQAEAHIERAAASLWDSMTTPRPSPSLKELAFFHLMRTKVTLHRDVLPRDYEVWQERGWLESDYFTDVAVPRWRSLLARALVRLRVRAILREAGIEASALSTSGSSGRRRRSAHDEHRDVQPMTDGVHGLAQQDVAEQTVAVGPHHEQVDLVRRGEAGQLGHGVAMG